QGRLRRGGRIVAYQPFRKFLLILIEGGLVRPECGLLGGRRVLEGEIGGHVPIDPGEVRGESWDAWRWLRLARPSDRGVMEHGMDRPRGGQQTAGAGQPATKPRPAGQNQGKDQEPSQGPA